MPEDNLQLFVKGLEGKNNVYQIHKDAKTDDLFRKIKEKSGIPVDELRLLYGPKQLETGKYLSDYHVENNSTLYLVLRLKGGMMDENQKQLDGDVELTYEPDMITWDDDPDNLRAKMPCGHAIGPESLTAYCRSLLTAGKFQFHCPYLGPNNTSYCGKEWDYVDVRRFAVLTEEERREFEKKLSENYLRKAIGIQECPKCKSFCERKSKKDRCVRCPVCTVKEKKGFDFCWFCLHEWQGSATNAKCGNTDCTGHDPRLKILQECPKKEIVGVAGCPSRRACIKCGLLIEHIRNCKHMKCPCGQEFCFICLKSKAAGKYPCGSFNTKCEVAAVQTQIPGAD
ncbi:uncharacterized protein LOC114525716 [Dendronephthya gigantea]|uniref:uncharacterized protein LOC114525716 n=1 Tax=Dendronephthya gigantea TaxID=151771 RepID=UPI00106CCE23|nr:uncharacterized protein LOC114525716 [Dendronephthya gigantea]